MYIKLNIVKKESIVNNISFFNVILFISFIKIFFNFNTATAEIIIATIKVPITNIEIGIFIFAEITVIMYINSLPSFKDQFVAYFS